jgi:hypothetical protein
LFYDIEERKKALAWYAKTFIGIKEDGPNKGQMIERFQKAVDQQAVGESWCVGFVQYCLKGIDALFGTPPTRVFATELATAMWTRTPADLKRTEPAIGSIAVWAKLVDGKPSWQGHTGIVAEIVPLGVYTIEGNTSSGVSGSQREGDGVFLRLRMGAQIPGFQLLGYIVPWG